MPIIQKKKKKSRAFHAIPEISPASYIYNFTIYLSLTFTEWSNSSSWSSSSGCLFSTWFFLLKRLSTMFFICFIDFLISNLLSVCPLFRSVPWELRGGQFSLFEPLESNLVDSVMASTILSPLLHVETFKARRTWKCIACSERFILPAHANIISKCIFFFF